MRKKPNFVGMFLVFIVVVAVGHLVVQVAFYGTGIEGFAQRGITGFASEGSETSGGIFDSSSISTVILFAEWGLILLGIVFVYAKHRVDLKKELQSLSSLKSKMHFEEGTELDNFLELLKKSGYFRLSVAAKVFDVDEGVVEEWAKTLETEKLATLTYPRIGGPKIVLRVKHKVGEKVKKADDSKKKEVKKLKVEIKKKVKTKEVKDGRAGLV